MTGASWRAGNAAWPTGRALGGLLAALALLAVGGEALAKCLPIAATQPRLMLAAAPAQGTVRLRFLGHSSFLIETPEGAMAVTDFAGFVPLPEPPQVVTMNNAHETHYTDFIPAGVELVLRGWDPAGGMAVHDEVHRDLRIWNVPTNVREATGTRYNGNSIFVFEVAGLCIAHLGHLHHLLTETHLGELGLIDVLLVPVDGGYTMAQELMVEVIRQIGPSLVIPMHYFGPATLARFLQLVEGRYRVVYSESPSVVISRVGLPHRQLLVLPGG